MYFLTAITTPPPPAGAHPTSPTTYYPHNEEPGAITLRIKEVVTEHGKADVTAFFAKK